MYLGYVPLPPFQGFDDPWIILVGFEKVHNIVEEGFIIEFTIFNAP